MDNQEFARFYAKYLDIIRAYIACRIPNRCDAEDLAQDVFVRLLGYGQLINSDTVGSFLFTIAHNIVTDVQRRYYRRDKVMAEWEQEAIVSANTTEHESAARELTKLHRMSVDKLPPQRRKVYELMDGEDWTVDRVAVHMNLSVRTVEGHLYLARKEIRARLSRVLQAV